MVPYPMDETKTDGIRCWLASPSGGRLAVTPGGILLGRAPGCDLVLDDPLISRHHLLVRMTVVGPELIPLGRNPIHVNGTVASTPVSLQGGDQIRFADQQFELVIEPGLSAGPERWALRLSDDSSVALVSYPFSVGGGVDDSLVLPNLPQAAMVLSEGAPGPDLTNAVECSVDGVLWTEGTRGALVAGNRVSIGDHSLQLERLQPGVAASTVLGPGTRSLVRIHLQFLPVGGRITLVLGAQEVALYLSERRCALIAVLLSPPGDYVAGEYVPDDLLYPKVWGRDQGDRNSLNVLINRTRKEFAHAGLDGFALIERLPGGGATRFRIEEGTDVLVD